MGLAASQGRLLSITARMSNNEFEQQSIAYSKQRLADTSEQINDAYLDAMNQTKYQVLTGYNGSDACYADLTYNQLTGVNSVAAGKQYLVKDNKGKVLVTNQIANAYKAGNGDFNIFLRELGYTQSDVDVTAYSTTEQSIHDAWDAYLVSVGKSIDDYDSQHILGFGYVAFSSDSLDGYVTYNAAYATDANGVSKSLSKDNSGYYTNRYTVAAKEYTDDDGETQTLVYYQTEEQQKTGEYTILLDVGYDSSTCKYTYTNSSGEERSVDALYVSEASDGTAFLSEEQKNYLTLVNSGTNSYRDEAGVYYTVTDEAKALNYEGTTTAQRELYDYAVAITEAYYNNANSKTSSNLTYDAEMINYYRNIFNQMSSCGYTTSEDESKFKDSDWFVDQLKSGALVLSYYSSTDKAFVGTTIDDDESISEQEDKSAISIAEQEYTASMNKLESQDKQFDLQLTKLESEHSALQTEYDSVKNVISKNVEKSYNIFNA